MIATYTGTFDPDLMIASDTNPWVEVDGEAVDWIAAERDLPTEQCPCGEWGPVFVPGVLHAMDSDEGIQRCDACGLFESDLDAALALADLTGGIVRYEIEED